MWHRCARAAGGRFEGNYVSVELDARGAQIFDSPHFGKCRPQLVIALDNTVYSDPVIKGASRVGMCRSPDASRAEAHNLVIVLKSGALRRRSSSRRSAPWDRRWDAIRSVPARFHLSLAQHSCSSSWRLYDSRGILADFGLTLNILLLLCMMAALGATLTLARYRGDRAYISMSVDANVLVNERMREELRNGKTPREA